MPNERTIPVGSGSFQKRNPAHFSVTKTPTGATVERERDLHEVILAECKRRGWIALHGSMAHVSHRTCGEPDFIIARDGGAWLAVECKSKIGKLTPEQDGMRRWAERLGHKIHVVRSMEEFRALL